MKCLYCGADMTPLNHNNRGLRCPVCWGRVEMEEAKKPEREPKPEPEELDWYEKTSIPRGPREVNATKGAQDLAFDNGLDIALIEGTGAGGKVLKSDVEKHLQ